MNTTRKFTSMIVLSSELEKLSAVKPKLIHIVRNKEFRA